MAYDHSRKAGNRGDVWKHYLLLSALTDILLPGRKLPYRESHCGSPSHALSERGEWRQGIGRFTSPPVGLESHLYFKQFRLPLQPGTDYPASWVQALALATKARCDLAVDLYDISPQVQAAVSQYPNRAVRFSRTDGFAGILRESPADFTLIDPPFQPEPAVIWSRLFRCITYLRAHHARFMVWYPIFWATKPNALVAQTATVGIEVHWRAMGSKPSQVLKGCGVVADEQTSTAFTRQVGNLEQLASAMGGQLLLRPPVGKVA